MEKIPSPWNILFSDNHEVSFKTALGACGAERGESAHNGRKRDGAARRVGGSAYIGAHVLGFQNFSRVQGFSSNSLLNFLLRRFKITAMTTPVDASHVALLSDSLQQLHVQQTEQQHISDAQSGEDSLIRECHCQRPVPTRNISKDGYGFRRSGVSTPLSQVAMPAESSSSPSLHLAPELLVADPNGLGWPGALLLLSNSGGEI